MPLPGHTTAREHVLLGTEHAALNDELSRMQWPRRINQHHRLWKRTVTEGDAVKSKAQSCGLAV